MKDAHSISTRRAYGVQRVCRVWRRARSSVYARRQATTSRAPCRRRGPVGAAPDDVLAGHIRRLLEASPFHGEGYRKAWAKLRVAGIRTSPERVRRLMREHDLQAPHRVGRTLQRPVSRDRLSHGQRSVTPTPPANPAAPPQTRSRAAGVASGNNGRLSTSSVRPQPCDVTTMARVFALREARPPRKSAAPYSAAELSASR